MYASFRKQKVQMLMSHSLVAFSRYHRQINVESMLGSPVTSFPPA